MHPAPYDPGATYAPGDTVTHDGETYIRTDSGTNGGPDGALFVQTFQVADAGPSPVPFSITARIKVPAGGRIVEVAGCADVDTTEDSTSWNVLLDGEVLEPEPVNVGSKHRIVVLTGGGLSTEPFEGARFAGEVWLVHFPAGEHTVELRGTYAEGNTGPKEATVLNAALAAVIN